MCYALREARELVKEEGKMVDQSLHHPVACRFKGKDSGKVTSYHVFAPKLTDLCRKPRVSN